MTVALIAMALLSPPSDTTTGWASAYAPGVMEGVVDYRFEQNWWRNSPPDYWRAAVGYVATTDCAQVGRLIHARPVDAPVWSLLLVADCGGRGEYGLDWMLRNNIIAELDAATFDRWTAVYGRPLKIEIRGETQYDQLSH